MAGHSDACARYNAGAAHGTGGCICDYKWSRFGLPYTTKWCNRHRALRPHDIDKGDCVDCRPDAPEIYRAVSEDV